MSLLELQVARYRSVPYDMYNTIMHSSTHSYHTVISYNNSNFTNPYLIEITRALPISYLPPPLAYLFDSIQRRLTGTVLVCIITSLFFKTPPRTETFPSSQVYFNDATVGNHIIG